MGASGQSPSVARAPARAALGVLGDSHSVRSKPIPPKACAHLHRRIEPFQGFAATFPAGPSDLSVRQPRSARRRLLPADFPPFVAVKPDAHPALPPQPLRRSTGRRASDLLLTRAVLSRMGAPRSRPKRSLAEIPPFVHHLFSTQFSDGEKVLKKHPDSALHGPGFAKNIASDPRGPPDQTARRYRVADKRSSSEQAHVRRRVTPVAGHCVVAG